MPKNVPTGPDLEQGSFPYSPVIEANGFVFVAGQTGAKPGTLEPVAGGIKAETRQMLENVGRLLHAVGLDYPDVVKATVYLKNMDDFGSMNETYREFFPTEPPVRATVGVSQLYGEFNIEIEVLAAR